MLPKTLQLQLSDFVQEVTFLDLVDTSSKECDQFGRIDGLERDTKWLLSLVRINTEHLRDVSQRIAILAMNIKQQNPGTWKTCLATLSRSYRPQ